jgi:hypothetical protein
VSFFGVNWVFFTALELKKAVRKSKILRKSPHFCPKRDDFVASYTKYVQDPNHPAQNSKKNVNQGLFFSNKD